MRLPPRKPTPGETAAPLYAGPHHHRPGDLRTISHVDKGRAFAREDARSSPGWRVDAKALGKHSTRPYLEPGDQFLLGITREEYEDLCAAYERKNRALKELRRQFEADARREEEGYQAQALRIQEQADRRMG